MLSVVVLIIIMPKVFILCVNMLNAVMLSVVAPIMDKMSFEEVAEDEMSVDEMFLDKMASCQLELDLNMDNIYLLLTSKPLLV